MSEISDAVLPVAEIAGEYFKLRHDIAAALLKRAAYQLDLGETTAWDELYRASKLIEKGELP